MKLYFSPGACCMSCHIIKFILIFFLIPLLLAATVINAAEQPSRITLLKKMFDQVAVAKSVKAIPLYYDKSFELYSNGKKMMYDEFLQMHQSIYKTSIQYKVRYDDETFIEQGNKVSGRLFITTNKPNELAHEIEVILIAEYKGNKLYRLWELTYPDWSKMKAFERKSK